MSAKVQQFDNYLKDNDLLYNLYVEHVKKELRDRLQPMADKIVNDCVEQAADSLKGSVESVYDSMNFGYTFRVILENKK